MVPTAQSIFCCRCYFLDHLKKTLENLKGANLNQNKPSIAKLVKRCIRYFYTIHTITLFPFKKKPVRACKARMARKTNLCFAKKKQILSLKPKTHLLLATLLALFTLRWLAGGKSNLCFASRRWAWVARPIYQTEASTFRVDGFFKTKDQILVCNFFWAAYFASNR